MKDAISLPLFRGRHETPEELAHFTMHGSMPTKSSPIEIPSKRRPYIQSISSPISRAISPDMIFEMSPVNSEHRHSPFSFGNSPTSNNSDVFVYSFPRFSSPTKTGNTEFNPVYRTSGLDNRLLSSLDTGDSSATGRPKAQQKYCLLDDQDLVESPKRNSNTTKITGFLPMKDEDLDSQLQDQNSPLQKLSPGPRLSSYTYSPWVLPGNGQGAEEDIAYSQADPSAFDYERQLLRRIQNQNRPRLSGLRSYM